MDAISLYPYHEGAAVFIGLAVGLMVGAITANVAFGLGLSVGIGAIVDGIMRIRANSVTSN